jgi:hypothetical protein
MGAPGKRPPGAGAKEVQSGRGYRGSEPCRNVPAAVNLFALRARHTLRGPSNALSANEERILLICGDLFSYRMLQYEFTKEIRGV